MRKAILYIMPILLVLALFGYWLGTNLSISTFLNELQRTNITLPNLDKIKENFNNLQFTNIWTNVANAWEEVYEMFTFFNALGQTFVAIFQSIVEIGKIIYYTIEFLIEIITFMVSNFISLGGLLYNYLFAK